jgi:hypothetical protein
MWTKLRKHRIRRVIQAAGLILATILILAAGQGLSQRPKQVTNQPASSRNSAIRNLAASGSVRPSIHEESALAGSIVGIARDANGTSLRNVTIDLDLIRAQAAEP